VQRSEDGGDVRRFMAVKNTKKT